MNKKEIYEHLANIYLDASSKSTHKKRKLKSYPKWVRNLVIAFFVFIIALGSQFTFSRLNHYSKNSQTALFLYQDSAKINFNFDPAQMETFSLDLKQLNISKYTALAFGVRKTNPQDIISLRIEFVNRFNEKSEIYIKNVSSKWVDHKIELSRFAKINDWSQMKILAFSIEEWNARQRSGIVYLDNIRLLQ